MKVIVYEPHYNNKHQMVLRALAEGMRSCGEMVEVRDLRDYQPCDVAVIFGAVKNSYPPTWPKREILQRHQGRSLLMVESAFVRRGEYWQIGWGGYAGTADFRNQGMPIDRWHSLGIPAKKWRKGQENGPVVVCGQLPRDTQVQDIDHVRWCRETVAYYARNGYPVLFRPHPRVNDPEIYGVPGDLLDTGKIKDTLGEARCFVTWNSTSCVDALRVGVPAITCHPSSIGWPVSRHRLQDVDDLWYPDRSEWLAGLGYAQWNLDEIQEGLPWRHLTR